jgi:hypothetical protein
MRSCACALVVVRVSEIDFRRFLLALSTGGRTRIERVSKVFVYDRCADLDVTEEEREREREEVWKIRMRSFRVSKNRGRKKTPLGLEKKNTRKERSQAQEKRGTRAQTDASV